MAITIEKVALELFFKTLSKANIIKRPINKPTHAAIEALATLDRAFFSADLMNTLESGKAK